MFIFLDWAIGYTLKQSADWVKGNVLFREDLIDALNDTAEQWNEELPKKFRIEDPETLFKPIAKESLDGRPHLQILRQQLRDGHIPEPENWANAALEHVRFVRRKLAEPEPEIWAMAVLEHFHSVRRKLNYDVDPIWEVDDEEIMPYLDELGRRLTLTIMQDAKTTLPLIYRQLQRIESKLDQLSNDSGEQDTS